MRTIVAGNWKMNKNAGEVDEFLDALKGKLMELPIGVEVVVAPAFPFLERAVAKCKKTPIGVAAQNCHQNDSGAFTGEVSVAMLGSIGVRHCIVGHSERREYYNENDEAVSIKVKQLLAAGITPIYCCGEKEEERKADQHFEVVKAQIKKGLQGLTPEEIKQVVVAYEPVWAIGTGLTASPGQAQEMHAHIRKQLGEFGSEVPILYGGSCKPSNAEELFSLPDVNGGLIGGAALKADDFLELIRIAKATQ